MSLCSSSPAMQADPGTVAPRRRPRLGELLALIAIGPVLIVIASVVIGIVTLDNGGHQRDALLNRVEPAQAATLTLTTAMVDQETGIRGYELTGERRFLEPYNIGRRQQQAAVAVLRGGHLRGV